MLLTKWKVFRQKQWAENQRLLVNFSSETLEAVLLCSKYRGGKSVNQETCNWQNCPSKLREKLRAFQRSQSWASSVPQTCLRWGASLRLESARQWPKPREEVKIWWEERQTIRKAGTVASHLFVSTRLQGLTYLKTELFIFWEDAIHKDVILWHLWMRGHGVWVAWEQFCMLLKLSWCKLAC